VTTVRNADEALGIVRKDNFDLLLIDVKMPKYDGPFLMRAIRKDLLQIPIVAMSGYPTPETIADVMQAGATKFIPKPFRPDDLANLVRQSLKLESQR
jgi:DNA-binding NtrC family response regulator